MTDMPAAPTIDDRSFAALRDRILPQPEEMLWQQVPWRITFWDAVQEAQATERPILLWAMNGHPLASTELLPGGPSGPNRTWLSCSISLCRPLTR